MPVPPRDFDAHIATYAGTLALDVATNTGWAHLDSHGHVTWGHINLAEGEGPQPNYPYRWAKLIDLIKEVQPLRTVIERPAGRAGKASYFLHGSVAVLVYALWQRGIPYRLVSSSEWKKHATGHGMCSKPEYCRKAVEIWGSGVTTEDEAAALHLLDYDLGGLVYA